MNYKFVPACSFDFLTPLYDSLTGLVGFGRSLQKKVLRMLQMRDGESFLDVGCGTGTLAILVQQTYPHSRIVGLDADKKILGIAKKKAEKAKHSIEFIQAYAEKMPFPSHSFNIVVSTLTFHHVPTEIKKLALKEIHRVLKPEGRFLLADFGKPLNFLWKIFFACGQLFEEGEYLKDNLEGKLPIFLREAGFQGKEMNPAYRGIQFLLSTKR